MESNVNTIKYKPESEEITPTQWKIIDFIFEHFDADFTGKTREDAMKFIDYWVSDVNAIKGVPNDLIND